LDDTPNQEHTNPNIERGKTESEDERNLEVAGELHGEILSIRAYLLGNGVEVPGKGNMAFRTGK
jgi:hypothetical protein